MPLTLQECHELLTMIHFIMGNNHELLTMIHLIKRISLLNQQSVCNSPHHFLTFSQFNIDIDPTKTQGHGGRSNMEARYGQHLGKEDPTETQHRPM